MSTLVVGDLHGKIDVYNEIMQEKDKDIVLIGDYLDSFDRSVDDQINLLESILYNCENNSRFTALIGNHELSYLNSRYMASGWNHVTASLVVHLKSRMWNNLKFYHVVDSKYLLTHAGVSRSWLPPRVKTLEEIAVFLDVVATDKLLEVGYRRGGIHPVGGPVWCDYWAEFDPIEGVTQIMGHTAYRPKGAMSGIVVDQYGNYNIDCLDREREILEIDNQGVHIRKF